jgi:hypothetical protein
VIALPKPAVVGQEGNNPGVYPAGLFQMQPVRRPLDDCKPAVIAEVEAGARDMLPEETVALAPQYQCRAKSRVRAIEGSTVEEHIRVEDACARLRLHATVEVLNFSQALARAKALFGIA